MGVPFCTHPFVVNPPGLHGHVIDRPWVEVTARYLGHTHRIWCIVDTGADDTILDRGTRAQLQINPVTPPHANVRTVGGGTVAFKLQHGVTLDFAGTSVSVDVLFGATPVPVLGRSALLAATGGVGAGFWTANWCHT